MKTQLEEAAEQFELENYGHFSDGGANEGFIAGAQWQQEDSKEAIEELVKALRECKTALSIAQSKIDVEIVDVAFVTACKVIDKHKPKQ